MELKQLMKNFPKSGRVEWIGVRTLQKEPLTEVKNVMADPKKGLDGEHYKGKSGNRHVTLIQSEDIEVVSKIQGLASINPSLLRRNLVVSGLNFNALKDCKISIGEVLLEVTGFCHPCSRMEQNLGEGGYNAMRGRGGLTARILEGGIISLGDEVVPVV